MHKINGCPLEYRDVQPEDISDVLDVFQGPYIRLGPTGYFSPKGFENYIGDIYNMPLRPSDVFVISYQRSGITWTQELVWLVANNLDYDTAASELLSQRYQFLDIPMFNNEKAKEMFLELIGVDLERHDTNFNNYNQC